MRRVHYFSAALLVLTLAGMSSVARASTLIFEVGGGISQIRNGSPFFGSSAPATADIGLAGNLSLLYGFGNGTSPIDLQFGVESILSNGTSFNQYYGMFVPYPAVRLQLSRIYLGAGLSPLILRRFDTSPGLGGGFQSGLAYLGQLGLLLPVTPSFSLALQSDAQFISSGGVTSPGPVLNFQLVLRFYFSLFGIGKGSGGSSYQSNEFKGFRYPFGIELRK